MADVIVTSNDNYVVDVDNGSASSGKAFKVTHDNGAELFRVQENGKLGLGNSSPSAYVDVKANLPATALTGTVSVSSGSNAVTGSSTAFTTELTPGAVIKIESEIFTVKSIASATSLTLDANAASTHTSVTAYKDDGDLLVIQNSAGIKKLVIDSLGNRTIGSGPWVDVKTFGAKGDGATDDTQAISNAINSLVNGGTVFIPAGTYIVGDLQISRSGITLCGMGRALNVGLGCGSATELKAKAGSTRSLYVTGDHISIKDLYLNGNSVSNIKFEISGSYWKVDNIFSAGHKYNLYRDTTASTIYGIYNSLFYGGEVYVHSNAVNIENNYFCGLGTGLDNLLTIDGAVINVQGNTFEHYGTAIKAATLYTSQQINIVGNYYESAYDNGTSAITLGAISKGCYSVAVENNYFGEKHASSPGYLSLSFLNAVSIRGNSFIGSAPMVTTGSGMGQILVSNNYNWGSGYVGIGEVNPDTAINVKDVHPFIRLEQTSSGGHRWSVGSGEVTDNSFFSICDLTATGSPARLVIGSTGNVGIGNTNPGNLLTMESSNGGYYSKVDHQWHAGSCFKHLKVNINDYFVSNILEIIQQVKIRKFQYKDMSEHRDTNGKIIKTEFVDPPQDKPLAIGYIYEELPKEMKEYIIDENGGLTMAGIFAYCTLSVQEIIRVIEYQRTEMLQLKKEIDEIKNKVGNVAKSGRGENE